MTSEPREISRREGSVSRTHIHGRALGPDAPGSGPGNFEISPGHTTTHPVTTGDVHRALTRAAAVRVVAVGVVVFTWWQVAHWLALLLVGLWLLWRWRSSRPVRRVSSALARVARRDVERGPR